MPPPDAYAYNFITEATEQLKELYWNLKMLIFLEQSVNLNALSLTAYCFILLFNHPSIIVCNRLISVMAKSRFWWAMFPLFQVNLNHLRRCFVLNYNAEEKTIDFTQWFVPKKFPYFFLK